MKVNRRQFIQITGAGAAGLAVSGLGFDLRPVKAHAQMLKTKYARETTTICPYCAVGCGAIVHTSRKGDGRVINIVGLIESVTVLGIVQQAAGLLLTEPVSGNQLDQRFVRRHRDTAIDLHRHSVVADLQLAGLCEDGQLAV